MTFAIIAIGPVYLPLERQILGTFVRHYEPDYNGGEGRVWFTNRVTEAKTFETLEQAQVYASMQSTKRPFLFDAEPNRPLLREFRVTFRELIAKDPEAPIDQHLLIPRVRWQPKDTRRPHLG